MFTSSFFKSTFIATYLLLKITSVFAQSKTNTNFIWVNYNNSVKLSKKWGVVNDIQFRTRNWLQYKSVIAFRSGVTYKVNDNVALAAGFAWFGAYRYFNVKSVLANEYRPWQELLLETPLSKSTILSNRLRLEQRFLQQIQNGTTVNKFLTRWRFRYKLEYGFPITKNKISLHIGNEVMVNVDNILNKYFFDQNRAYFFVSIPIVKHTLFQFQYIKIFQWQADNDNLDNQNIFRCSIHQKINY